MSINLISESSLHGGKRSGAGRSRRTETPVGLRTKHATALNFAMAVINDPDAPLDAKIRVAIAVLPFQHAKLAEQPATKKGAADETAAALAAEGNFAVPSGPRSAVIKH